MHRLLAREREDDQPQRRARSGRMRLEPIDFDELAADMGTEFVGNIVVEGLKRAQGIVTLFTPDEYAALFTDHRRTHDASEEIQRWQARPNVILGAGIAFGIARDRTVLATMGSEVSLFSDTKGIHIVRLNNSEGSRKSFRQKLIGAGCAVDQRADSYTDPARSGDFEAPVSGEGGPLPVDPFAPPQPGVVTPPVISAPSLARKTRHLRRPRPRRSRWSPSRRGSQHVSRGAAPSGRRKTTGLRPAPPRPDV